MRLKHVVLAAGFAGGISVAVAGQQPPDFSGTWRATKTAPAGREAAPTPVFGEVFGLRHRGQTLDLIRPVRGREHALVHVVPLDGSEQRQVIPGRMCLGDTGSIVKASWNGQAIDYTLVSAIAPGGTPGAAINLVYTFRREGADRLAIETSMRDAASGAPKPVATVYERSTDTLPEAAAAAAMTSAPAKIADVSWIAGDWVGTTGATTYEERWTPTSGGVMLAISRTMRNGAMTAFEFLCISERESTLVYTAMPNGQTATDFTLTKVDADSATFENPAHSFPKMIRYAKRPDGTMEAVISGTPTQKPTTFVFKRAEAK